MLGWFASRRPLLDALTGIIHANRGQCAADSITKRGAHVVPQTNFAVHTPVPRRWALPPSSCASGPPRSQAIFAPTSKEVHHHSITRRLTDTTARMTRASPGVSASACRTQLRCEDRRRHRPHACLLVLRAQAVTANIAEKALRSIPYVLTHTTAQPTRGGAAATRAISSTTVLLVHDKASNSTGGAGSAVVCRTYLCREDGCRHGPHARLLVLRAHLHVAHVLPQLGVCVDHGCPRRVAHSPATAAASFRNQRYTLAGV